MVTVSFLVEFVHEGSNVQHVHDICVYEYIHAPGFVNRAKKEISGFVDKVYGPMAYGYTHHVNQFSYPLGKINIR